MVQGGPNAFKQTLTVATQRKWTVKADNNASWITPDVTSGSAGGAFLVGVNYNGPGLAVGNYSGTLAITADDNTVKTVGLTLRVVAKSPDAVFSYISGPNGCTQPLGLPDAAVCVVPGEKPPGNFVPPPAGRSYFDPNFGARVRVLADPPSLHGYSSPNPLSAGNKYAIAGLAYQPFLLDAATGSKLGPLPNSFEGPMWDALDSESYYYLEGSSVKKFSVKSMSATTLLDYSKTSYGFTAVKSGSRGDTSKDNWIPFFAPNQSSLCALDLNKLNTYCAKYDRTYNGIKLNDNNAGALISKGVDSATGKRYVVFVTLPVIAIYSVNLATGALDFEYLGPEKDFGGNGNGVCEPDEPCLRGDHYDSFEDSNGLQSIVGATDTQYPCEFSLYSFQLNKGSPGMMVPIEAGGGRKKLLTLFRCGGDTWTNIHNGCAKFGSYCVTSTTYGSITTNADGTIKHSPHVAEVMVIRDNGKEIRRLMMNRSVPVAGEDADSYWTTPRAAISNDGAYVVVDSNFGLKNQHRVLIVETGFGKTRLASSPGLVDAVGQQSQVAPGGIGTVYGENLAHCRASAQSYPLPPSICGTSLNLNGKPTPLYYVSPSQINFYVPQALPPQSPAILQVTRGPAAADADSIPVDGLRVVAASPSMFSYTLNDGVQRAVVLNPDGSLNGPEAVQLHGLKPGDVGVLYANGLGLTTPSVEDGMDAPVNPLARTLNTVNLYLNGVMQTVLYSGLAPTYAGLYQINFLVDPATPLRGGNDDQIQLKVIDTLSVPLAISIAAPAIP